MAAQDPSNEPALIYGKIVELPAGTVSPPQELAQVLNQLFAGVTGPRGMSLNAYARKIFESQGSVSRWLNGHRTPPARFVQQLMRDFEKETGNVIPDEVRAHIQALHVRAIEADNPFRAKEQEYLYQLHDAQERSEEAEATIRVLRSRVVNLEREVDERQLEIDRMATRAATTVSEYEDRIERLERERDVLADDLTRMRRSVERYEAEQERARAESKQLEDALDRLQRTMELAGGAEPADREEPDAGPIRRPAVWGRPMPGRNKYFTGRTVNLRRLRRHLSSAGGTVVLHGIGGVGKTQLAIEYAWRYQSSYDLVWWISADQPPLIGPAIAGMAPDLELPDARAAGIEETARRVKEALSIGEPYRRWLLIVDNAIDPQSLGDLIPRGPGHVIITSRNARWNGSVSAENIDVFTREDSLAFLRRRWSREAGRDAGRLAEMLDDLPLALEQAAALQNMTGMQIDEYLQLLGEQTGELLHLAKSHDYPHSMTAAFTLSIHQLAETSPHAAKILQCCAFFGPDPIPRAVFRPFWGISDQLGEVLSDPGRLSGSLSTLQRRGLIAVDSAAGTIQVHRLVQALVRDGTPAELRDAYRRDARLLVAGSVPSSPEDAGTWATYRELIPHAEHCGLAEGTTPLERAATCDIARFLYLTGDYRTAHD
ncbi:FxSxx-COOH system tetratricopeptide repeat protein, partial [Nonomuraea fuscirosea]|uniref:FxSxx-COOH system tetratricopeptide repeat protein n=1 Tax=Nonomuraea fuscirosea TaxID=1291556 RepID=UPI0034239761